MFYSCTDYSYRSKWLGECCCAWKVLISFSPVQRLQSSPVQSSLRFSHSSWCFVHLVERLHFSVKYIDICISLSSIITFVWRVSRIVTLQKAMMLFTHVTNKCVGSLERFSATVNTTHIRKVFISRMP